MRNTLLLAAGLLFGTIALTSAQTVAANSAPAWHSAPPAASVYGLATPSTPYAPATLVTPPHPLGTIESSVMPPGPGPSGACSVAADFVNQCSAMSAGQRCSAFNGGDDVCSAFDAFTPTLVTCSAIAVGAVCSVLPPQDPAQQFSFCSAVFIGADDEHFCSSIGNAGGLRCSVKGQGDSFCSTNGAGGGVQCSVLSFIGPERSFCSTKFNQPTQAKGCSTWGGSQGIEACSVFINSIGTCTTFGAAAPHSCSAFAAGSHCSVIGGAAGNFCVQ